MLDMHTEQHGCLAPMFPCWLMDHLEEPVNSSSRMIYFVLPLMTGGERYLIPTAEVPLTNLVRDSIIDLANYRFSMLHIRRFRAEAGSYGRDVRGMFRQHQLTIELVWITHPDHSWEALESLRATLSLCFGLGLHFRVVNCGAILASRPLNV